jgi:hypothetical protein
MDNKIEFIKWCIWSTDIWLGIKCSTLFDLWDYIKKTKVDLKAVYCTRCKAIVSTEYDLYSKLDCCIKCKLVWLLRIYDHMRAIHQKEKWNIVDIWCKDNIDVAYAIVDKHSAN